MRRPTRRDDLIKYYEALHDALEREMTRFPIDLSVKGFKFACRQLECRLELTPDGASLIQEARERVANADEATFVALHVLRGAKDLEQLEEAGLLS